MSESHMGCYRWWTTVDGGDTHGAAALAGPGPAHDGLSKGESSLKMRPYATPQRKHRGNTDLFGIQTSLVSAINMSERRAAAAHRSRRLLPAT
jgi:hypothetical protein